MTKCLLVLFVITCFIFSGCGKPTASFTTDKTEYEVGETIHITNTSRNGYRYHWVVSNYHEEFNTKDLDLLVRQGGDHDINLRVYSKNGRESDQVSRMIFVAPDKGQIILYLDSSQNIFAKYFLVVTGRARTSRKHLKILRGNRQQPESIL